MNAGGWRATGVAVAVMALPVVAVAGFAGAGRVDRWRACDGLVRWDLGVYAASYHPVDGTCVVYTDTDKAPTVLVWDGSAWVAQVP